MINERVQQRLLSEALTSKDPRLALTEMNFEHDATPLSEACLIAADTQDKRRLAALTRVIAPNLPWRSAFSRDEIKQLLEQHRDPCTWKDHLISYSYGGFRIEDFKRAARVLKMDEVVSLTVQLGAEYRRRQLRSMSVPGFRTWLATSIAPKVAEAFNQELRGSSARPTCQFVADYMRWWWNAAGIIATDFQSYWILTPEGTGCIPR